MFQNISGLYQSWILGRPWEVIYVRGNTTNKQALSTHSHAYKPCKMCVHDWFWIVTGSKPVNSQTSNPPVIYHSQLFHGLWYIYIYDWSISVHMVQMIIPQMDTEYILYQVYRVNIPICLTVKSCRIPIFIYEHLVSQEYPKVISYGAGCLCQLWTCIIIMISLHCLLKEFSRGSKDISRILYQVGEYIYIHTYIYVCVLFYACW